MAINISKLLSKKIWTGTEVGKLLLATLIHEIKNNGNNRDLLFSVSDIKKMVSGLVTKYDKTVFTLYMCLFDSIIEIYTLLQDSKQQLEHGISRNFIHLKELVDREKSAVEKSKTPLILTKTEYDKIIKFGIENRRATKYSYMEIVFVIVRSAIQANRGSNQRDIPKSILRALEATMTEPVTNERILANYNEDTGKRYYSLPNGKHWRQSTGKPWGKVLKEELCTNRKYITKNELDNSEDTMIDYITKRHISACELLYKGADALRAAYFELVGNELPEADDQQIEDAFERCMIGWPNVGQELDDSLDAAFFEEPYHSSWHYEDTLPVGITKYSILETPELLYRYTGGHAWRVSGRDHIEEISELAQFKEFITDYPELYNAIRLYIEEHLPKAKGLTEDEYGKTIATFGELVDYYMWGCGDLVNPDATDFEEYYWRKDEATGKDDNYHYCERINKAGIAIIQNPSRQQVNEAGEYVGSSRQQNSIFYLDKLDEEAVNEIMSNMTELIIPSLRKIYDYNALIDIFEVLYNINDLSVVKVNVEKLENGVLAMNDMIYFTYFHVYGSPKERMRKREMLRDLFKPINIELIMPSQSVKREVKTELGNLDFSEKAITVLSKHEELVTRLMKRDV